MKLFYCKLAAIITIVFAMTLLSLSGYSQRQIKGVVHDENQKALQGATIVVKGSNVGTSTDEKGAYELRVPSKATTLVISSVGFGAREVTIGNKAVINIGLEKGQTELEQVVVVGYGKQKKENLTGAVDQIGSEYFENQPVPNLTRALQGAIPNLNISMIDGKPIRDPSYNIRGTGSIGAGGNALVLIDGVEGEPSDLNPNDIASVTVLKDAASAAIYGSRGTFGVVLITTKAAQKGKVQLSYAGSYSINKRTTDPDWVTSGYIWSKMFNESYLSWTDYVQAPKTVGNFFPFSADYLETLKERYDNPDKDYPEVEVDPSSGKYIYYGNTDWQKLLYADNSPSMEHSLSVSGGSDKVDYRISSRLYQQDGIFRSNSDKFNQYTLRFKGGVQVTDWLKINASSDFSTFKYHYPISAINKYDIWTNLKIQGFPIAVMFNPDGTLTRSGANTVGEFYYGKSSSVNNRYSLRNTVDFEANAFNKKLNIKGDITYTITDRKIENKLVPLPYSEKPGESTTAGTNSLSNTLNKSRYIASNLYATYTQNLGGNHFKALVGTNIEDYHYDNMYIQRDNLLVGDLSDFNLAVGEGFAIRGGGYEWATVGVFYRLNYDFKNKYLIEFNGRYDGSSKFPESQAFGFFPSVSAGWNIAKENFMQSTKSWLNNFKLRASYGSLGNGQIATYMYQETIRPTTSARVINGAAQPAYIQSPSVVPDGLTWETSTTLDFGADIDLLKNKFSASFDWYRRSTTAMITTGQPLPAVFGAAVPKGNYADLHTEGFELSLNYRGRINTPKPITFSFRATLADNVSVIDKYYNPSNSLSSNYKGKVLGDIYGYRVEGLFTSEEEILKHADQSFIKVSSGNKLLPGDLKFADLNGDNKINSGRNTLDDHGDLTIIGNERQRYPYSFTTNWSWNNLSLFAFFQGIGKRNWWPGHESGIFWGQYTRWYGQIPKFTLENAYTLDNPNLDAYFPRYRGPVTAPGRELGTPSDRYLQDVSYIRLKKLTVSYAIPKHLTDKMRVQKLSVYLTGNNIWTYSPMFKLTKMDIDPEDIEGSDPEIRSDMGDGAVYPMMKGYTFGINLIF